MHVGVIGEGAVRVVFCSVYNVRNVDVLNAKDATSRRRRVGLELDLVDAALTSGKQSTFLQSPMLSHTGR